MHFLPKPIVAFIFCLCALKSSATEINNPETLTASDTIPNLIFDSTKIFERASVVPTVSKEAWDNHLQKTLKIVYKGVRNKMPPGSYTIQVRFLVERDGSISEAMALSDPGFRLAECAVIIIKTGPKWNPAESNGKKVRSYHHQPITFEINN